MKFACFFLSLWIATVVINAQELNTAYLNGADFAKNKNAGVMATSKTIDLHTVPGFMTDHPQEINYQNSGIKSQASNELSRNVPGQFIENRFSENPKTDIHSDTLPFLQQKNNDTKALAADVTQLCRDDKNKCSGVYSPSPDFNQAISSLSGTSMAAKDFNGKTLFAANWRQCRKDFIGFSNCCSDAGWGIDLNLTSCDRGEKQLGLEKEAGMCVEIGSFCSDDVWDFCTMHSKTYCCFHSKLARIIQVQGRQQLGISWGDAETPNCRGLTLQELQHIDFSRIDFSEFYQDIRNKEHLPDVKNIQKRIQEDAQRLHG